VRASPCSRPAFARAILSLVLNVRPFLFVALALASRAEPGPAQAPRDPSFCQALEQETRAALSAELLPHADKMGDHTGVYVLERGDDALIARAWLSANAEHTIDIQYFIFSADNVGLIASDFLLRAAERGVRVRILVDDLLVDADADQLLAFDAHPNLEVRIYNPNVNLGKSWLTKAQNVASDFRAINQRMHNKTFIVDGKVVVTGGRNVADEYFDYDQEYSFRDRDLLLLGGVTKDIGASFETFWNGKLSHPLSDVVQASEAAEKPAKVWASLHEYACDPANFWPSVREQIKSVPEAFARLREDIRWVKGVRFVSDVPGKNDGTQGLKGGGVSTDAVFALVKQARKSLVVQSPYLVTTELGRGLFRDAVKRGVTVKILSNSLASTDNLDAFSGYARSRDELLDTGVQVFEWRPDAAIRKERMADVLEKATGHVPIFGVHAKTMVVDGETLVVGTYNLDPRSTHLNTECITIVPSVELAQGVLAHMREEMKPENAWHTTHTWNPDGQASLWKRLELMLHRVVPVDIL
jgi:putative cardiolipin synthase